MHLPHEKFPGGYKITTLVATTAIWQLVIEYTVGLYVPLTTIFSTTVTWGLAWRLPTHPAEVYLQKRAAGEDPDHQHRLTLVNDLAVLLDK